MIQGLCPLGLEEQLFLMGSGGSLADLTLLQESNIFSGLSVVGGNCNIGVSVVAMGLIVQVQCVPRSSALTLSHQWHFCKYLKIHIFHIISLQQEGSPDVFIVGSEVASENGVRMVNTVQVLGQNQEGNHYFRNVIVLKL